MLRDKRLKRAPGKGQTVSLQQYREKRKFDRSPEPKAKRKTSRGLLRFVVQKHQASRLHYDFRLELGGALKSWAVPKGPSRDPEHKRLAIQVEDHPLDYRTFEGIIPAGNYGAGTVMVWDEGTYHPPETTDRALSEEILERDLKKGHLRVVLEGKKLKGEFALIKLRKDNENHWLLIKKRDQFVGSAVDAGLDNPTFHPAIFIYDNFPGGIGLSRPLYEIREQVLNATGQLILSCSRDDGCPSCVGPMAMAKEVALSILDCLKHE